MQAIDSSWEEILFGVPQRSILGTLLLNIFVCDLFIILEEIDFAGYANNNTHFVSEATPKNVVSSLKAVLLVYLNGFQITK